MTQTKSQLSYCFEYEGYRGDPRYTELRVNYLFSPGIPGTGTSGSVENYDPGSGHELDYDFTEREVEVNGKKIWQRLKSGEWLDEHCRRWLASLDDADLREGMPGGERDPDAARERRMERRMMDHD